jgi:hypothetical protein
MANEIVDLTLHLHEELAPEAQCRLEDFVREQEGVVSAGVSVEHPHLMMVAYNSDRLHAVDILHHVQSNGLHAELIGL